MPNENTSHPATRLGLEALEAREVPATFGATRGLDIEFAEILPFVGGAEYITATGPGTVGTVRVLNQQGGEVTRLFPFGRGYTGGIYLASGDVNDNGQLELIVSMARGSGMVRVIEFIDGGPQYIATFNPFGPVFSGGVQVAVGNVSGDLRDEIIVGQGSGGSLVKVYSHDPVSGGTFQTRSFQAYEPGYTGGVTLASANIHRTRNVLDVNGNLIGYNYNYAEIITGKGAELPHLKIFDAQTPTVRTRASYFAFDASFAANRRGIDVAAGSTDGRRGAELYVALRNTGIIRILDGQTSGIIGQIRPYPLSYSRNVNMALQKNDEDFGNAYNTASLIVVAGDGPYFQIPIVYRGVLDSPAGLNGRQPAG